MVCYNSNRKLMQGDMGLRGDRATVLSLWEAQ